MGIVEIICYTVEMMLDGTLCECCGAYIDSKEVGYARLCEGYENPTRRQR